MAEATALILDSTQADVPSRHGRDIPRCRSGFVSRWSLLPHTTTI